MVEKAFYKTGSFEDWLGKKHTFTVCAVVYKHTDELVLATPLAHYLGLAAPVSETNKDGHLAKSVFLGVSICNPIDEWNKELGEKIAYNRALASRKEQRWIASNINGLISDKLVDVLLEQEILYLEANPDKIIPGYNQAKIKYEKKMLAMQKYKALSAPEQSIVKAIAHGSNIEEFAEIASNLGEEPPVSKKAHKSA